MRIDEEFVKAPHADIKNLTAEEAEEARIKADLKTTRRKQLLLYPPLSIPFHENPRSCYLVKDENAEEAEGAMIKADVFYTLRSLPFHENPRS